MSALLKLGWHLVARERRLSSYQPYGFRLTGEHGVELDDGAVSYDRDVDAGHRRLVAAGLDQVERWQAQS